MDASIGESPDRTVLTKRGELRWCLHCLSISRSVGFLSADIPGSTEFFQYGPIALWTTLGLSGQLQYITSDEALRYTEP